MKLIVGLGNPGEKYEKTRHNLGFMVVEHFLKDFEPIEKTVWSDEPRFKSDIVHLDWQPKDHPAEHVVLAKPKTYMNNSGMAVSLLAHFYKIEPDDIWIVYDEIDLPFGSLKIRKGGASAGHHGVESVMESLQTDSFWRFRLGIGQNHHKSNGGEEEHHPIGHIKIRNVEDYVLGTFTGRERGKLKDLTKRASHAIQLGLEEGLLKAMNRFNTK